MNKLSEKNSIYLLLIEPFFAIFTSIIVTVTTYGTDSGILENNVVYHTINAILLTFIYINIAKINRELRITAILTYICLGIKILSVIILNYFPQILLYNPYIDNVFDLTISAMSIPMAYYFCKGFHLLVSQKTQNVSLAQKWSKLLKANVDLAVINLIFAIVNDVVVTNNLTENIAIASVIILVSFGVVVYGLYLLVLRIIYLLKTAKELS